MTVRFSNRLVAGLYQPFWRAWQDGEFLPNLPADDPRRTYVEFVLEPAGGGTLLRVTETGFAQLPIDIRRETYESHRQGWLQELAELIEHLDGA